MEKSVNDISDNELIEGVMRQDSHSLTALYNRYFDKVYHQCLTYVKEKQSAFDLTQDILLKAFLHLPSFRRNANFSSWLWSLGTNHCKDYIRKNKNGLIVPLEDEKNIHAVNEDEEEEGENLLKELSALLEILTEKEKEILILKYARGTTIKELQQIYHLSESAVKMRLSRAKEKLISLFHQKHPYLHSKSRSHS